MEIPWDLAGRLGRENKGAEKRRAHLKIFGRVTLSRSSVIRLEPFLDFFDRPGDGVWACRDALIQRIFEAGRKKHWRSLLSGEVPENEAILESLAWCHVVRGTRLDEKGTTAGEFLDYVTTRKAPLLQLPCGLTVNLGHLVWLEKKGIPVPPPLLLHWSVGRLLASERPGETGALPDPVIARKVSVHLGVPVALSQVLAIRNGLRRFIREAAGKAIAPEGNPFRDGFPIHKRRSSVANPPEEAPRARMWAVRGNGK